MGNKVMPNEVLYHIGISAEMLKGAEYALLPGDPGRVEALARALGTAEPVGCHREYTSWLADVEGTSILVCSTGMGGPSVAIGMEELARLGIKNFIRVGTTGSIQKDVELGDLVINKAAVRLDGTSQHYAPLNFPAVASFELTLALQQAAESLSFHIILVFLFPVILFGLVRNCYDSYTGYVRKSLQGSLQEWQALGALNYEMETAALFIVAQSFGLQAASICGVVAKRTDSELVAPPDLYELASQRFQAVVKKTLQDLIKAGK